MPAKKSLNKEILMLERLCTYHRNNYPKLFGMIERKCPEYPCYRCPLFREKWDEDKSFYGYPASGEKIRKKRGTSLKNLRDIRQREKKIRDFYREIQGIFDKHFPENWRRYLLSKSTAEKKRIQDEIVRNIAHDVLERAGYNFGLEKTPLEKIAKKLGIVERESYGLPAVAALILCSGRKKLGIVHNKKTLKEAPVFRRVNLAHEIAHAFLGKYRDIFPQFQKRGEEEKICEEIAYELILPRDVFDKHVKVGELKELFEKIVEQEIPPREIKYEGDLELYRKIKEMQRADFERMKEENVIEITPSLLIGMRRHFKAPFSVLMDQLHWSNLLTKYKTAILKIGWAFSPLGMDKDIRVLRGALPKGMYLPELLEVDELNMGFVKELYGKLEPYSVHEMDITMPVVKFGGKRWRKKDEEFHAKFMKLPMGILVTLSKKKNQPTLDMY